MADDRHDLILDQLVGCGDGLSAIAIIVSGDHLDLLAEHTALGDQVGDRSLGTL